MAVLTVVNVVLLIADAGISFPFSAFAPQLFYGVGQAAAADENGAAVFLAVGVVLAAAAVGIYFLCWALSKKHAGAMTAALILFALDSLLLAVFVALAFEVALLIDVAFHAWVLYYLISAVAAFAKLKALPPEEVLPEGQLPENPAYPQAAFPAQPADEAPAQVPPPQESPAAQNGEEP